jgi:hypothetical protein
MIRIYDGGNQLTLTRELGANTNPEYYLYSSIKSVSWTKDVIGNYFLLINFITDDSDNPLKVKLLDTGSSTSAAQYANTEVGAKLAVQDLHTWINNSFELINANTRVPVLIRVTTSGTIAPVVYSISVSNVGAANGTFLGGTIKPGETLNFDAGALNNFYAAGTIAYNGTGTELVIIYNV